MSEILLTAAKMLRVALRLKMSACERSLCLSNDCHHTATCLQAWDPYTCYKPVLHLPTNWIKFWTSSTIKLFACSGYKG